MQVGDLTDGIVLVVEQPQPLLALQQWARRQPAPVKVEPFRARMPLGRRPRDRLPIARRIGCTDGGGARACGGGTCRLWSCWASWAGGRRAQGTLAAAAAAAAAATRRIGSRRRHSGGARLGAIGTAKLRGYPCRRWRAWRRRSWAHAERLAQVRRGPRGTTSEATSCSGAASACKRSGAVCGLLEMRDLRRLRRLRLRWLRLRPIRRWVLRLLRSDQRSCGCRRVEWCRRRCREDTSSGGRTAAPVALCQPVEQGQSPSVEFVVHVGSRRSLAVARWRLAGAALLLAGTAVFRKLYGTANATDELQQQQH